MGGNYITDGFSTYWTFSLNGALEFQEITVKGTGPSRGGPINRTTMRNVQTRTQKPKSLNSYSQMTATGVAKVDTMTQLTAMLGLNQQIVQTFPDGKTCTQWGWVESAEPSDHEEGTEPTIDIVVELSNLNASDVETPPVWA